MLRTALDGCFVRSLSKSLRSNFLKVQCSPIRSASSVTPSSEASSSVELEPTKDDYEALLRQILPMRRDSLDAFLTALVEERKTMEAISHAFDAKVDKMAEIRDEIRTLVEAADRRSIERRDEIVQCLQKANASGGSKQ